MSKIIELWQKDCEDCQAVAPIVAELEKEGFVFEKYDIDSFGGRQIWHEYEKEIYENSKRLGLEVGYIYTPTFINPKTRKVIAYGESHPSKEELIALAGE